MYSVLIVEDEILVSIGLKNMIDWAGMDMVVVGEARDGRAALELYRKLKPDLILTDIKMPVMDGLEMIEQIRKDDRKTKIIILTCHQEFDFLRQAMKLGVTDYILKYKMSTEEMQAVVAKVHEELLKESAPDAETNDAYFDVSLVKEKAVKDYLVYGTCSDVVFERLVEKLKMRLGSTGLMLCIMQIDGYAQRQDKADHKYETAIRNIIGSLIGELLENLQRGEIVSEREGRYLLLFSLGDILSRKSAEALLYETLGRISQIMKTYVDTTVTFGISSRGECYGELKEMCAEAALALEQSYYVRGVRYFRHGEAGNHDIFQKTLEKFRDAVRQTVGLNDGYRAEILSAAGQLGLLFGKPATDAMELFTRLIYWPAANSNDNRNEMLGLALEHANRVRACPTMDEAMEAFLNYLQAAIQSRSEARFVSREVAEAVKFIRENYSLDISLQQVADHVEMSSNYLSSLIKKELQVSFVDYLNRVRIDRAGELLMSTHMKSYDIAQKVGFTDESYFSRIFKRIKGVRPTQYKKMSV